MAQERQQADMDVVVELDALQPPLPELLMAALGVRGAFDLTTVAVGVELSQQARAPAELTRAFDAAGLQHLARRSSIGLGLRTYDSFHLSLARTRGQASRRVQASKWHDGYEEW